VRGRRSARRASAASRGGQGRACVRRAVGTADRSRGPAGRGPRDRRLERLSPQISARGRPPRDPDATRRGRVFARKFRWRRLGRLCRQSPRLGPCGEPPSRNGPTLPPTGADATLPVPSQRVTVEGTPSIAHSFQAQKGSLFVVKLTLRDKETAQEAVRRFRKLVERSGIKKEIRVREFYEKPSETRRRARLRAQRRARRDRLMGAQI
jgi:small subunit ribosomal protein S21